MTIVGAEKPSLEDTLAHYGVVGMKWGHRKQATGSQIRQARRNVANQHNNLVTQRDKVKATKKGTPEREAAQTKLSNMQMKFLNNPDRVIAARLTRGEKAAAIILLTPGGAAAAIGATSAVSRRIERKQDLNKYNKS